MTTERDIKGAVMVAITALPHSFFVRTNTGAGRMASGRWVRFSRPGQPDITGSYKGRYVAIELKGTRDKQRPQQEDWQQCVERAGGIYIIARSVDDVLAQLSAI